jgi:hypothetical protein
VPVPVVGPGVPTDRQAKNATRLAADGTSACAASERPLRPLLNKCCVTFLKINKTLRGVLLLALWLLSAPSPATAQSGRIGLSFTGSTYNDARFIPPDTMGAVGPNQIVELINGRYSVYDKSSGNRLDSKSLNDFWTAAGATPGGSFAFDPRALYDSGAQRWYASSADNAGGSNNSLLFAVSKTSNPLDGWTGFKIPSDPDGSQWADFPQLGYNSEGVYLSANMNSGALAAVNMLVLPKADLLAASPSIDHRTLFDPSPLGYYGSSWQPVVDYDNTSLPATLFSQVGISIVLGEIRGPIGSPSLAKIGDVPVTYYYSPPSAAQPGPKAKLATGDDRIPGSVILRNGYYYGVQNVATAPTSGKAAIRWFEIDAAAKTLRQEGLIADSQLDLYYPSIAVNQLGDLVIGCSGSSDQQYASAYAIVGKTDALGNTSFGNLMLLKAGLSDYQRLDRNGLNRWGDYSATVPDPTDPSSFWTFQEFASAPVSGQDQWAIQITQIIVPEPSTLVLALTAIACAACAWRRSRHPKLPGLDPNGTA